VAAILDGKAVADRIQGEVKAEGAMLDSERGVGPTTVAMPLRNRQQAYRLRVGG